MQLRTGFDWRRDHGHDRDVDGGQDVDDGEDEVDLDGPVPLGVLPAEVRQAEHRQADAHLQVKDHVRQRTTKLAREEALETQERTF